MQRVTCLAILADDLRESGQAAAQILVTGARYAEAQPKMINR